MVNKQEVDNNIEDKRNTSDLILNLDIIDTRAEITPREEEINHLEVEDSEPHRANQDSTEVEVKLKERSINPKENLTFRN